MTCVGLLAFVEADRTDCWSSLLGSGEDRWVRSDDGLWTWPWLFTDLWLCTDCALPGRVCRTSPVDRVQLAALTPDGGTRSDVLLDEWLATDDGAMWVFCFATTVVGRFVVDGRVYKPVALFIFNSEYKINYNNFCTSSLAEQKLLLANSNCVCF